MPAFNMTWMVSILLGILLCIDNSSNFSDFSGNPSQEEIDLLKKIRWIDITDRYDANVLIVHNRVKPVASGVLIGERRVVTSCSYVDPNTEANNYQIVVVNGLWNWSRIVDAKVEYIFRGKTLHGKKGRSRRLQKPNDDIMFLALAETIKDATTYRMPRVAQWDVKKDMYIGIDGFRFSGFAFVDRVHIHESTEQDVVETTWDLLRVDCDDFIPRAWGKFLCLRNVERVMGVHSGMPLWYLGVIYGVGSFAFQRGKDRLLMFTDLRQYADVYNLIEARALARARTTKAPIPKKN